MNLICPGYPSFLVFKAESGRRYRPLRNPPDAKRRQTEGTIARTASINATDTHTRQFLPLISIPDASRLIPGGEPIYRTAFMNVLYDRFLQTEDKETGSYDSNLFVGWVASLYNLRGDVTLPTDAILALSTALVGADICDPAIIRESRSMYQRTISGIRHVVDRQPLANDGVIAGEGMMLTCMACAKYEVRCTNTLVRLD